MRNRHPTTNPLDDIFFSVLIIAISAIALYHGVVTIIDTPQYQAAVAAINENGTAAATTVARAAV